MRIETPLIALIIGSLFFFGMYTIFTDLGDNYQDAGMVNLDNAEGMEFNINNNSVPLRDAFNKLDESKAEIKSIERNFTQLKPSVFSVWPAIQISFRTGKQMLVSILHIKDVGTATTQVFGIDESIASSLFLVLFIILLVSIVLIVAGRTQ